MKKIYLIVGFIVLISVVQVSAVYIEDNRTILNKDHAIRIKEIAAPSGFSPGESGRINITLKNNAMTYLDDLRIQLILPDEFKFDEDVDKVKISRIESLEEKEVSFDVIASSTASSGIYDSYLIINYVSFLKIGDSASYSGDDKQDNYTFSLTIKGKPEIFTQIENSGIYKGNEIGDVTIKFINNGVGDAKFLTIELLESESYDIISNNKEYVGDLDSDDFESVDFRIKINKEKTTDLLLKADYKDSLNGDYSKEFRLPLEIRSAKELGIDTNGTLYAILAIIFIAVIGYFIYKKYKKRKKKINGVI